MTIRRQWTRLLLGPRDVPSSSAEFEVIGVFNPGAVRVGKEIILLVRVAERPREIRPGWIGLARWDVERGATIDWVPEDEWEAIDPRVVRNRVSGRIRLTFLSHLRVVHWGQDRDRVQLSDVTIWPENGWEEYGVEDPRITRIDGRFFITYVAVSKHGPATALASTTDFRHFERHGIIFCPENKDVVLFPEKVGGQFAAIHRPVCGTPFTRPEMWFARSPDLRHWGAHEPLVLAGSDWRSGRVGAGPPPLRVPEGWLLLYHGNRPPSRAGDVGAYFGGALLLDEEKPFLVRRIAAEPFLAPEADFEVGGFVPNVVFPTAVAEDGDYFLVFYGAADQFTAVTRLPGAELLAELNRAD